MVSNGYPSWLTALLTDTRAPPKLFAWSPANVDLPIAKTVERCVENDDHDGGLMPGDSDSRIFIVGPGNVGRLYATYMAQHSRALPITLVVRRKELLSQWATSDGVVLTDRGGGKTLKSKRFRVEWWSETRPPRGPVREVADGRTLRNVFVSTKADAGLAEADRLRRYLGRGSSVVFAQNGVSQLWPPYGPLYVLGRYGADDAPAFSACVVNHGISSAGPFQSIHAAPADAFIGPIFYGAQPQRKQGDFFIDYISSTPTLDTKAVSAGELWLIQLEKLVVNAAINPLTTILRCKTGQLFASYDSQDALTRVLDRLLWQASAVIQALIHHDASVDVIASYAATALRLVPGGDDYARHFARLRRKLAVRFSQPILKAKLYAFGLKISEHRSSMLQDAEAGRKTEIRDVNGWILDMAEFVGGEMDVSVHRGLVELIEKGDVLDKAELARRLL